MKSTLMVFILYAVALGLTFITISPINNYTIAASILLFLVIAGFLVSLCLTVWYEGTFKERFGHSHNPGFMLTAGTYILGYAFIIVESLIRK